MTKPPGCIERKALVEQIKEELDRCFKYTNAENSTLVQFFLNGMLFDELQITLERLKKRPDKKRWKKPKVKQFLDPERYDRSIIDELIKQKA